MVVKPYFCHRKTEGPGRKPYEKIVFSVRRKVERIKTASKLVHPALVLLAFLPDFLWGLEGSVRLLGAPIFLLKRI